MIPVWKYEEYSAWSRQLAAHYTRDELEKKLYGVAKEASRLSKSHLSAIEKSTSMQSNSQRRAQTRNCVSANYEERCALKWAIDIYDNYPEHTKSKVLK